MSEIVINGYKPSLQLDWLENVVTAKEMLFRSSPLIRLVDEYRGPDYVLSRVEDEVAELTEAGVKVLRANGNYSRAIAHAREELGDVGVFVASLGAFGDPENLNQESAFRLQRSLNIAESWFPVLGIRNFFEVGELAVGVINERVLRNLHPAFFRLIPGESRPHADLRFTETYALTKVIRAQDPSGKNMLTDEVLNRFGFESLDVLVNTSMRDVWMQVQKVK